MQSVEVVELDDKGLKNKTDTEVMQITVRWKDEDRGETNTGFT